MRSGFSRGLPALVSRAMPTICQGPSRSRYRSSACVQWHLRWGRICVRTSRSPRRPSALAVSAGANGAAGDDRNSCRLEVLPRNTVQHRAHVLLRCRRIAGEGEVEVHEPKLIGGVAESAAERTPGIAEALEQPLIQSGNLFRFVACQFGSKIGNEQMGALEAKILILKVAQRTRNRPAPTSSSRQNMICAVTSALGHQRLSRPPLLTAVRVLALRSASWRSRPVQRRRQAEEQSGQNRNAEREPQNSAVRPRIQRSVRSALRDKRNQSAGRGKSESKTEHAAREREQ